MTTAPRRIHLPMLATRPLTAAWVLGSWETSSLKHCSTFLAFCFSFVESLLASVFVTVEPHASTVEANVPAGLAIAAAISMY